MPYNAKELRELLRKKEEILSLFEEYALHAYNWEPRKEGDFHSLDDGVLNILLSEVSDK